ncbi:unnamed protein product [Pedinophyceae sp. YPF-701]|nr:unnamed protein product [Pedinophyceae sp. YPF-701]
MGGKKKLLQAYTRITGEWHRMPSVFANIPLQVHNLTADQEERLRAGKYVPWLQFRTPPHYSKVEVRQYLERLYGAEVLEVHSAVYEGRKKRVQLRRKLMFSGPDKGKMAWQPAATNRYYREPDWKKFQVVFKPPPELQEHMPEIPPGYKGGDKFEGGFRTWMTNAVEEAERKLEAAKAAGKQSVGS